MLTHSHTITTYSWEKVFLALLKTVGKHTIVPEVFVEGVFCSSNKRRGVKNCVLKIKFQEMLVSISLLSEVIEVSKTA
ncbi:hypothetical protein LSTR_LSTR009551 [Laodelphax striatellus]|uniref:Uncharacterized protein n=1 Tax=Laodelphax striatellus TaxID=195883 RepID=A0A482WS60_LAOST|nr:hypothetical protein LSTR_LSTR009551 [Laodelphax striatellus]